MKKYKDSGAQDEFKRKKKQAEKERKAAEKKTKAPPASKKAKTASNAGAGTGGKFTSKEYIEDDDSSSDSDKEKEKDKKKKDTKDVSFMQVFPHFSQLKFTVGLLKCITSCIIGI